MHGTVMIFLAVVPLLAGAYGNYIVPLQIGAREMAFPRLNAASFWLYLVAGLVSLVSFFVPMGAANSGWTSYPPLAVLATQGQDYWLVAIFANPLGIDRTDPDARDDIGLLNVLMLPLGRPVVLELASRDVIHSFTLNEMRVRQDAVPGMETRTWFTPIVAEKWDIACSQLCGCGPLSHAW